jgi:glycosyltransferase involved in cell wall biosynthesis
MRVAYLVNQYPKVSHSFIRREILALERQGIEVLRFASRGWDAELADADDLRERTQTRYLLEGGLRKLVGPALRAFFASPWRFACAFALACRMGHRADRPLLVHLAYLAQACRLVEWLRQCGATHVHAHFATNPAEVAMLVRALGGPPYSFTVHGPEEFDRPLTLGLREKLRRAAFVVAVSSFARSQLYRWVEPAHWPKIRVVHCGLEDAFHAGAATPLPLRPRLVCVARLAEQKGQLLLLEAAHRLVERGIDFELVLAGDGELRETIEARIARLGLRNNVYITGWISSERVRAELLAARALVLASFAEGLPVVVMEAMALRRPVITTYVAGIPELVRPGDNGWLVPAGDVEALVHAMAECLASPAELLARMGDSARRRVLERHDIDTEAAKLAALFGTPAVRPVMAA